MHPQRGVADRCRSASGRAEPKRTVGMTGYGRASQATPPLCVVRDRPATRRTLPKAVPARKAVSTARRLEGLKNVRSSGVAEWGAGNAPFDSAPCETVESQ